MMRAAVAGVLALSLVPLAAAETAPPGMAARTELHTVDTLTLSDAQFLKGDPAGKATTLTGEFRIDASTREPFSYKDPCVETDPHVGYDAAATEAAKKSVKEFLSGLFKL